MSDKKVAVEASVKTSDKMRIISNAKRLEDDLSVMKKAALSNNLTIYVKDGVAYMRARGSKAFIQVDMPYVEEVEGTARVTVRGDILMGAVKGRGKVSLELKNGILEVTQLRKNSRYKASVTPMQLDTVTFPRKNVEYTDVSAEISAAMAKGMERINIRNSASDDLIMFHIEVEKGLRMMASDGVCLAVYNARGDFGDNRSFVISSEDLKIVQSLAAGEPYNLTHVEGITCAKGEAFTIQIPSVQTETFDQLHRIIKSSPKKPTFTTTAEDLKNNLVNLCSVYDINSPLKIFGKKGDAKNLRLRTESPYGVVQDSLKGEGTWEEDVNLNPLLMRDCLQLGTVTAEDVVGLATDSKSVKLFFKREGERAEYSIAVMLVE